MNAPPISYKRHRFPPQIIARAVWLLIPRDLAPLFRNDLAPLFRELVAP
jgi:hypothetical protein